MYATGMPGRYAIGYVFPIILLVFTQLNSIANIWLLAAPTDDSIPLVASVLALRSPGDLQLSLALNASINMTGDTSSTWIVDVKAGGKLTIAGIVAKSVTVAGGGLLRAVANTVLLRDVTIADVRV